MSPAPALHRAASKDDLQEVFQHHRPVMQRLVGRILSDPGEVEEALQEASLRAWKALPQWRGEAKLSTWLGQIAINQALQTLRQHQRHRLLCSLNGTLGGRADEAPIELQLEDESPSPLSLLLRKERAQLTRQCVERLPPSLRGAVVAIELQQKSFETAAAELGLSVSAVKSRHHRGKAILRKRLLHTLGAAGNV